MVIKLCCRCNTEKPENEFSKDKNAKDGLCRVCKQCNKEYQIEYRKNKQKKWDGRVVAHKVCSKCGVKRPASDFNRNVSSIDGMDRNCKICKKSYRQKNRDILLAKSREYNIKIAASEKIKVDRRVCSQCNVYKKAAEFWKSKHTRDGLYSICVECKKKLEQTPERKENRSKCVKEWRKNNLERSRNNWNNWDKNERKTNPIYKLRRNTMHAIVATLRKNGRGEQFEKLSKAIFDHLPYTADELKAHLEAQFEDWMTWDNWGKFDPNRKTWQIDHINPQSKFPFSSFEDDNFKKLWELSNLRPLETVENIAKGNR